MNFILHMGGSLDSLGSEYGIQRTTHILIQTRRENVLSKAVSCYLQEKMTTMYVFLPSIDSKSPEPFLPRHPYELIPEMKEVPLIIGYNDQEGVVSTSGNHREVEIANSGIFIQLTTKSFLDTALTVFFFFLIIYRTQILQVIL